MSQSVCRGQLCGISSFPLPLCGFQGLIQVFRFVQQIPDPLSPLTGPKRRPFLKLCQQEVIQRYHLVTVQKCLVSNKKQISVLSTYYVINTCALYDLIFITLHMKTKTLRRTIACLSFQARHNLRIQAKGVSVSVSPPHPCVGRSGDNLEEYPTM